jgi:hypothetical protein
MIFGLVTRRELDRLKADLTKDQHDFVQELEEIKYEWAKWFNKFRSLYAMLLKREKSAGAEDEPGGVQPAAGGSDQPRPLIAFPHSRRGF